MLLVMFITNVTRGDAAKSMRLFRNCSCTLSNSETWNASIQSNFAWKFSFAFENTITPTSYVSKEYPYNYGVCEKEQPIVTGVPPWRMPGCITYNMWNNICDFKLIILWPFMIQCDIIWNMNDSLRLKSLSKSEERCFRGGLIFFSVDQRCFRVGCNYQRWWALDFSKTHVYNIIKI